MQAHVMLSLSVLTCVQMPLLEKLLLLQVMAELLALHPLIWQQLKHCTMESAIEIKLDQIKHASTQT